MNDSMTALQQFLAAYFNQDWVDDYASADDVIDSFLMDSSRETIIEVRREILELAQSYTNEPDFLKNILQMYHCYFYYPNRWSSGPTWLNHIVSKIDKHLILHEKPS